MRQTLQDVEVLFVVLLEGSLDPGHEGLQLHYWQSQRLDLPFEVHQQVLLVSYLLVPFLVLLLQFHPLETHFPPFLPLFLDILEVAFVFHGYYFFLDVEGLFCLCLQFGVYLVNYTIFAGITDSLEFPFFSPAFAEVGWTGRHAAKPAVLLKRYHFFILTLSS